ncbi:MAG TPA: RidA family protein [Burkholderiales bacterium]|jgi:enamine deaminase RidA (YjgF/YER057c/UK114 family)
MTLTDLKPAKFPWFDYSRYSFSLGVRSATGTYLSGHTGSEYDAAAKRIVVRGTMTDQVRTAWAKIGAILESGGLGYADVVRVVEYVKPEGIERYAEADGVRREVFKGHQPVVNTVPVKALLRPEAFIEIEVTASAVPGRKETSGVVFLPTVQPVDDQGNIVGAGDVAAQTRAIFERASRMLAALGVGFDRVVKTLDYITPAALAAYKGTGRVRRDHLGPVYPGAAGILMPRLVHPEALIQYDFIATRDTPVAVNPGWTRYQKLTYSPAVRAGKLLFMSGQGSLDPATERVVHDGDVVAQAEYTYGNVIKVLEAAGGDARNLVKTIEYVTPAALARYRDVAKVREKLLHKPWPASTGLVCEALLRPEMQIEVDPFAILD